jgi:hypothetical protein
VDLNSLVDPFEFIASVVRNDERLNDNLRSRSVVSSPPLSTCTFGDN